MKTGILTYYSVHNHGAVLQAYALNRVLTSMGEEVEFLTFQRNYDNIPIGYEKKYTFGLSSIKFYFKYLLENGAMSVLFNYVKNKILVDFKQKNFCMGKRYSDTNVDNVFIGSDEVFSIEIGINHFFYGHGIPVKNVFSYAGCFGPTVMKDIEGARLRELIGSGLKNMEAISVRDYNSYSIAKELAGKEPTIVCDPVILYGYKEEMQQKINVKEKYLLVYAYDKNMNSKEEIADIKKFAKTHSLKVYSVGYYHKWCDKNVQASPFEMLAYIKNADFVITDTFHGSVMSLICNTQFCVKLRNNSNKVKYLLSEHEQLGRIIEKFSCIETLYNQKINFHNVNKIIEERRDVSLKFLENCLRRVEK